MCVRACVRARARVCVQAGPSTHEWPDAPRPPLLLPPPLHPLPIPDRDRPHFDPRGRRDSDSQVGPGRSAPAGPEAAGGSGRAPGRRRGRPCPPTRDFGFAWRHPGPGRPSLHCRLLTLANSSALVPLARPHCPSAASILLAFRATQVTRRLRAPRCAPGPPLSGPTEEAGSRSAGAGSAQVQTEGGRLEPGCRPPGQRSATRLALTGFPERAEPVFAGFGSERRALRQSGFGSERRALRQSGDGRNLGLSGRNASLSSGLSLVSP